MTDDYADRELRRTLFTAFPEPLEGAQGNWERVVELAVRRPTPVGRVFAGRRGQLLTGRKARLAVALAAGGILLLAAGVALASETGLVHVRIFGLNILVSPQKAEALKRREPMAATDANTTQTPVPPFTPDPIPAHMLPPGTPVPVSASIIQVTNDWIVSDGYTLVAVYAGSGGVDSGAASAGRVVIVRQNLVQGTQSVTTVDAGNTAALTITSAPLGASVEKSAQTGDIELQAADGQNLVLHLATDTISSG